MFSGPVPVRAVLTTDGPVERDGTAPLLPAQGLDFHEASVGGRGTFPETTPTAGNQKPLRRSRHAATPEPIQGPIFSQRDKKDGPLNPQPVKVVVE